jgi:phage tail sheath protein FI
MAVKVSYPGVYIEEFAPGAPVQAAATNVAAFLGPLAKGPIVKKDGPYKYPVKVTSLDQFYAQFGSRPAPGFFTWYAVRGFFENGGRECYVYRVSNADYGKIQDRGLTNRDDVKLADVFALVPGELATPITFEVRDPQTPLLTGATLFSATARGTITGSEIRIDPVAGDGAPTDARAFRVGDSVLLLNAGGGQLGPLARVKSVTSRTVVIEDRYPEQAVTVKLMYDSGNQIRVTVADLRTLPVNALAAGTTLAIGDPAAPSFVSDVIENVSGEQLTATFKTFRVNLRNGLQNKIDPEPGVPVAAVTFDVSITQDGAGYLFGNLAPDAASDDFYATKINKYPSLVRVVPQDPPPMVGSSADLVPAIQPFSLSGGENEDLPNRLSDALFTAALDNLRRVPDVRLLSIPDGYPRKPGEKPALTAAVHAAAIAHCEQMADRFAVLDPEPGLELFGQGSIEERRAAVDSARGYAALYYPWVRVPRPGTGPLVTVPPSGHVCGLMAFVDDRRGVFKAPANEILQGTVGVERTMSEAEHGILNLQGINVIRVFRDGARPVVYGARTTATDRNWQYVNVRRLFLFLEKSIQDGIRYAVFEPNNKRLWSLLRQTISSFLLTQWQAGALFGGAPAEAYYVRIDDALNSFEDQRQGRLNIEIGIRPTYPAEFIVVRIGIWNGGAEVTGA